MFSFLIGLSCFAAATYLAHENVKEWSYFLTVGFFLTIATIIWSGIAEIDCRSK